MLGRCCWIREEFIAPRVAKVARLSARHSSLWRFPGNLFERDPWADCRRNREHTDAQHCRLRALSVTACLLCALSATAQGFSFEDYEREERETEAAALQGQRRNLDRCCPSTVPLLLWRTKLLSLSPRITRFGRVTGLPGSVDTGRWFRGINGALGRVGLRTYTQQQITDQIARAEREAVAVGDVDAALSAADRLGAGLVLNADIRSTGSINPVYGIDEISVTMQFDMRTRDGRYISSVSRSGASYRAPTLSRLPRGLFRSMRTTSLPSFTTIFAWLTNGDE